jgi:hypothetical protein
MSALQEAVTDEWERATMTHQQLSSTILITPRRIEQQRAQKPPSECIDGWQLGMARTAWFILIAVSIIYFISGMPTAFRIASTLSPDTIARLQALGLAANFSAIYILVLDSATFLLFTGVALLIFKERSNGRMALITSAMLVLTAMLYTAPGYEARAPLEVVAAGAALAEVSHILFLLTFPSGRFFPRWSRWILPPLLVWRYLVWAQIYLPRLYSIERTGEKYPFLQQDSGDLALFIIFYIFGIVLQICRYRRKSTPQHRLQMRWLMWGVTIAVTFVGGYVLLLNTLPAMQSASQDMVIMRLVGRTVRQLALCILPVALLYSVVRYDLWDIDLIVNRSLVYLPLTSILAVIYATSLALTQKFFVAATGQESEFAMVLTTLLLTMVFTPIRSELQKFVDAHFKEAPDPLRRLETFDQQVSQIAQIMDLQRVSAKLLEEAIQAFDALGGAIFLIEESKPRLVHISEQWSGPIVVQVPLISNGYCVGWLVLGARSNGRSYSNAERTRLSTMVAGVAHVIALLRMDEPGAALRTMVEADQSLEVVLPLPRVG